VGTAAFGNTGNQFYPSGPSKGSKGHASGTCHPCLAWTSTGRCRDGADCNMCHYEHSERVVIPEESGMLPDQPLTLGERVTHLLERGQFANLRRALLSHHKLVCLFSERGQYLLSHPERVAILWACLWMDAVLFVLLLHAESPWRPGGDPVCAGPGGRLTSACLWWTPALRSLFLAATLGTALGSFYQVCVRGRSFDTLTRHLSDEETDQAFRMHILDDFPWCWHNMMDVRDWLINFKCWCYKWCRNFQGRLQTLEYDYNGKHYAARIVGRRAMQDGAASKHGLLSFRLKFTEGRRDREWVHLDRFTEFERQARKEQAERERQARAEHGEPRVAEEEFDGRIWGVCTRYQKVEYWVTAGKDFLLPQPLDTPPLAWQPSSVMLSMCLLVPLVVDRLGWAMFSYTASQWMWDVKYDNGDPDQLLFPAGPERAENDSFDKVNDLETVFWLLMVPQAQRFVLLLPAVWAIHLLLFEPLVLYVHLLIGEPNLRQALKFFMVEENQDRYLGLVAALRLKVCSCCRRKRTGQVGQRPSPEHSPDQLELHRNIAGETIPEEPAELSESRQESREPPGSVHAGQ